MPRRIRPQRSYSWLRNWQQHRPPTGPALYFFSLCLFSLAPAIVACGSPTAARPSTTSVAADSMKSPADREVALVMTGCGHSSDAIGSGVMLTDHLVLTAAHVIAGSNEVRVVPVAFLPVSRQWPEFSASRLFPAAPPETAATVIALDRRSDLALLALSWDTTSTASDNSGTGDSGIDISGINAINEIQIDITDPTVGAAVEIFGVAVAGPTAGLVTRNVRIVTDQVRGTGQVERLGYLLDAATSVGDSGAGIWADGRLAGLVFAVTADSDATGDISAEIDIDDGETTETWAVTGSEIESFLARWRQANSSFNWTCDADQSQLLPADP